MKKVLLMMLVMLPTMLFTACSSDDDDNTSELQAAIIGKWRITQIEKSDGTMLDVTTTVAESVFKPTYAIFYSDGDYEGYGYFGNGSGTYKVSGNKIYTYVDGDEYLVYTVSSYTSTTANLTISMSGSSSTINAVVEKQ